MIAGRAAAGALGGPVGLVASAALPLVPGAFRWLKTKPFKRAIAARREERARNAPETRTLPEKRDVPPPIPAPAPQGPVRIFDERSEKYIATLIPKAQEAARAHLGACLDALSADGLRVKIISGTRTYAEQDALYARGRTTAGAKVTNAKGGYSNHNFGIAWDIAIFRGQDYLEQGQEYTECGLIGERLGLEWGGRWTSFQDPPHYQLPTNLTMNEMRERVAKGEAIA